MAISQLKSSSFAFQNYWQYLVQRMDNSEQLPQISNEEGNIFDNNNPLPVFYSENALLVFSVLFGALFSSVMLAMNINATKAKRGMWQVIGFGVLYTIMQGAVVNSVLKSSGSSVFLNVIGAVIIRSFLWKEYLGSNTLYTKRSVAVPAIIGAALTVLVLLATFYAQK